MLAPSGTTIGHFLLRGWVGGGSWLPPSPLRRGAGVARHPDRCRLAKVCRGKALPWPNLQEHVGIKVSTGAIVMVRKGMYGGVARVPPEVKGVA